MDQSIFICPVCSSPLSRDGKTYLCTNTHRYDIAKEGYVNLLLANQKQSREPGDSKEMLDARKSFLTKGYYKPLARSAASIIIKYKNKLHSPGFSRKLSYCQRVSHFDRLSDRDRLSDHTDLVSIPSTGSGGVVFFEALQVRSLSLSKRASSESDEHAVPELVEGMNFTIIDAGCGEGYYTDYISKNRYINESAVIYGIDISKEGIKSASKRNGSINFAVAGIYHLPILDNSADIIMNIFAPFDALEFSRVLKNNGIIISVTPGANHLYELKKNLYDDVYLNDEKFDLSDKFCIAETVKVSYELNITDAADIGNLLKMTPYYHKSSPEKIESFLNTVENLKTTADFVIRVLKKSTLRQAQ